MPWRPPSLKLRKDNTLDPYKVLISEIMLQQTQVERVTKKFPEFIAAFPSFHALSRAPLQRVLRVWQGMGYNRRAVSLKRIARRVEQECGGTLPRDPTVLESLPGIGYATANSIAAFAFNAPTVFIETNIRRAFIHHFFPHTKNVSDKEIVPLVAATLDRKRPREWYWALMDYGARLRQGYGGQANPNRRSAQYARQSKFEGSVRQARGAILKTLIRKPMSSAELQKATGVDGSRIKKALAGVLADELVQKTGARYRIHAHS